MSTRPADSFLLALADLRDPSGFSGQILVDLAQGCPRTVKIPAASIEVARFGNKVDRRAGAVINLCAGAVLADDFKCRIKG